MLKKPFRRDDPVAVKRLQTGGTGGKLELAADAGVVGAAVFELAQFAGHVHV